MRDKRGNRPLDLVNDVQSEDLQKELRAAIEDSSSCDCLMLKTSLKKTEKSLTMPIAFLAFFDGVFAVLILFVFPGK